MGLPILLSRTPRVWRSNPLQIPIRCYTDKTKKTGLDLTGFGTSWASQVRETYQGPLIASFTIDTTNVTTGELILNLDGATTTTLTASTYVFDVEATGGSLSPLTVFLGRFYVDGDVTRA